MKLTQPNYSPVLYPGMRMQCAFRCEHYDEDDDDVIEWCTGEIMKVRNGSNLENLGKGNIFHRKDGVEEVQWEEDVSKVKEIRFSIV